MLVNQLHTLTLLTLFNNADNGISTIPPIPKISSKDGVTSLASLHPFTGTVNTIMICMHTNTHMHTHHRRP